MELKAAQEEMGACLVELTKTDAAVQSETSEMKSLFVK